MSKELSYTSVMYGGSKREADEMRFYCCVSVLIVEILCPFLSACLAHSKNKSIFKLCQKNWRLFNCHVWFGDRKMNGTCRIVG
jgi:hypothetical protein